MKEAISNRHEDVVEKEKVMFPEIVVRGTDDKPYYEIKYYDVTDKQWHLGYGSYNLEYVKQWKEECLEIVEGSITNVLFEKIKEGLEERQEKLDTDMWARQCDNWYGERQNGVSEGIDVAIKIVNQVAEEYVTDTNVGNKDGWIPVSSGKLPEEKENPVTRDWYVYPGHHGPGIMDKYVTHWMDIKPYQPKGENNG